MKLLPGILLVGFISIAVFGFMAMNDNHETGCIATTVNGGVCPAQDPLGLANFYLSAFRYFSNAVFSGNFASFFLAVLVSALISSAVLSEKIFFSVKTFTSEQKRYFESFLPSFRQTIVRWLALRENSPALI